MVNTNIKKNTQSDDKTPGYIPEIIIVSGSAFFLVLAIIMVIYIKKGFAPFGTMSMATDDGYWQYMDFFAYYLDVLHGKQGLPFAFSNGLGTPGLALFMYYLSSPFNLLILFFSRETLHSFFNIVIALKLSTIAATMAIFLQRRFEDKLNRWICIGLAVSFGLMQYSFAKCTCTMWLDGVYMLPIMMLGVYRLVKTGRPFLLSISVGLAILFNWYSAGFDCLFSGLWVLFEMCLIDGEDKATSWTYKGIIKKLLSYCLAMIIGVMLSAFLFLPMIYLMREGTRGNFDWSVLGNWFHGNIISVVTNYIIGSDASNFGNPCLFAGGMVLLGCIGFFASDRIKARAKIGGAIVLGLSLLSCFYQPLYWVFSLFQDATSYYYRHSYLCCFILVVLAGCFFSAKENTGDLKIGLGVFLYIFTLFLANYSRGYTDDELIYITVFFQIAIYYLFIVYDKKKGQGLNAQAVAIGLCVLIVAEMWCNARNEIDIWSTDTPEFMGYQKEAQQMIDMIKEKDTGVYRMTQTMGRAMAINQLANLDEAMGLDYKSVESYTSVPTGAQISFLERAGYRIIRTILVEKAMSILSIDSLLGVKYIMSPYPYETLPLREDMPEGNNKKVYENIYCMPMAFKVEDKGDFYSDETNAFLFQNELFDYLFDMEGVFLTVDYTLQEKEEGGGVYNFVIPDGKYALYGQIPHNYDMNCSLDLNGRLNMSYGGVNSMGIFYIPISEGDTSAYLDVGGDIHERLHEAEFALLDLRKLEEMSITANANTATDITIEDGYVHLNVKSNGGENIFTSVPLVKGWEITRNGMEITPYKLQSLFAVIPLEEGDNDIIMKYHIPYLVQGIIISIISIVLLAGWRILMTCNRKKEE